MGLKKWFKSKPYWLRGGLIVATVSLFLLSCASLAKKLTGISFLLGFSCTMPLIIFAMPIMPIIILIINSIDSLLILNILGKESSSIILLGINLFEILKFALILSYYFALGSLIGLIIHKIKFRKK